MDKTTSEATPVPRQRGSDSTKSLSILLPAFNSNDLNKQPITTTREIRTPDPLARELERISNDFIVAISAHDFNAMLRLARDHIAPDFESWIDNYIIAKSISEYLRNLKHLMEGAPKLRCTVLDVNAAVDDTTGRATIFQLLEITGRPENLRRLTVCMMCWRRRRGEWECYQSRTVRGLPGSGVVGDI